MKFERCKSNHYEIRGSFQNLENGAPTRGPRHFDSNFFKDQLHYVAVVMGTKFRMFIFIHPGNMKGLHNSENRYRDPVPAPFRNNLSRIG